METKNLKFELFSSKCWKWFTVHFESDSPVRNRPMEIIMDEFKLDVAELAAGKIEIWTEIKSKMEMVSKEAWSTSDIPSLAYHLKPKINPVFLFVILFFLMPFFSKAQDTIYCRQVKLADNVGISMKTGKILYSSHRYWKNVDAGFMVKEPNGKYLINGKEYQPGNKKHLKIKK